MAVHKKLCSIEFDDYSKTRFDYEDEDEEDQVARESVCF